jgi:hypothetical protein
MNPTSEDALIATCEAADEEIRKATNGFFVLAGLQSLSILDGDIPGVGIALTLGVLAALVRVKRSRVAAVVITVMAGSFLLIFLKALPQFQPWPERLHAVCLVTVLVVSVSTLRATWRYQSAAGPRPASSSV